MGGFLDKPVTEKDTAVGQGKIGDQVIRYATSGMQGWRFEMEDAHVATCEVGNKPVGLFCVFDGHAGKNAALHAGEHITRIFSMEEGFERGYMGGDNIDALGEALAESFFDIDEDLLTLEPFKDGTDHSGCTALAVSITDTHVVFCNAGDSRAIFVGNGGTVMFSTIDHKPDQETELNRIVQAGAAVYEKRVNGDLAVSRALGDFAYKKVVGKTPSEQPVTCKPDITIVPRRHDVDEFILLGCDGIWDVISNDNAAKFILEKMTIGYGLGRCCELLLDHCLELSSHDNMTVVLVALNAAPKQIGTFREPAKPAKPPSSPQRRSNRAGGKV